MHEAQMHTKNCWITLTYDNQHLPLDCSLVLRDWQLFAKSFRAKLGPMRFYHCGEYGDENKRPHYHACIFGHDFGFDRTYWRTSKQGNKLYRSKTLEQLWTAGNSEIGTLTQQSAGYTARYIMKKQTGRRAAAEYGEKVNIETGEVSWIRRPPYTTMSRNPGIGSSWLKKYMSEVYPNDEVIVSGRAVRPPKYYDREHAKKNPVAAATIKAARQEAGEKHKEDNTYDRLAVKEEVLAARTSTLTRKL